MGKVLDIFDQLYNSPEYFLSEVAGLPVSYDDDVCYCIVEGKTDKEFYSKYFSKYYDKITILPVAKIDDEGNKTLVKQYLDDFNGRNFGSKHQFLFFIDRDFGGYINDPNIPDKYGDLIFDDVHNPENLYVTDDYSIENSIFTKETIIDLFIDIKKVLNKKRGITEEYKRDVLNKIGEFYNAQLRNYEYRLRRIIALLIYCKTNSIQYKLRDVSFNDFFIIEPNGKLCFRYLTQDNHEVNENDSLFNEDDFQKNIISYTIDNAQINGNIINYTDVLKIENDIQSETIYHIFRGHFLEAFWFRFGEKFRRFQIDGTNTIPISDTQYGFQDTFRHCAYIESLSSFIDRTIIKFKQEIKKTH